MPSSLGASVRPLPPRGRFYAAISVGSSAWSCRCSASLKRLSDDPRVEDCHARLKQGQQRDERLSGVLDAIRSMHGPAAANYGMNTDMPGGYLGAKIAFGRIPDLDDFDESKRRL